MKAYTAATDSTSTFLMGTILFANLEHSDIASYVLKAAIGGAIMMVFKITGDYLSHRMLHKKKRNEDDENGIDENEN